MKELLLGLSIIPFFGVGFYIMKRIDSFIIGNRKTRKKTDEIKEPSEVILSGKMPLIEIDKEIDLFRKHHEDFAIILKGGKVAENKIERE